MKIIVGRVVVVVNFETVLTLRVMREKSTESDQRKEREREPIVR